MVYVLDCSGTMGLDGRLARARAALLATLAALPDGARVQVVTYTGRAAPLVPGGLVPLTDRTRAGIAAALAKLDPAGASRHVEGLRTALLLEPDAVLLLTDTGADELAGLAPLVRGARKPAAVSVARVTAAGVLSPAGLP